MEALVLQLLGATDQGSGKLSEASLETRAVAVFGEAAGANTLDKVKLYNVLADRRVRTRGTVAPFCRPARFQLSDVHAALRKTASGTGLSLTQVDVSHTLVERLFVQLSGDVQGVLRRGQFVQVKPLAEQARAPPETGPTAPNSLWVR